MSDTNRQSRHHHRPQRRGWAPSTREPSSNSVPTPVAIADIDQLHWAQHWPRSSVTPLGSSIWTPPTQTSGRRWSVA